MIKFSQIYIILFINRRGVKLSRDQLKWRHLLGAQDLYEKQPHHLSSCKHNLSTLGIPKSEKFGVQIHVGIGLFQNPEFNQVNHLNLIQIGSFYRTHIFQIQISQLEPKFNWAILSQLEHTLAGFKYKRKNTIFWGFK